MPVPATQLISEGFGTGDSSKTYPVPVASQIGITNGAASFADGFPPLTRTALDAGGIPPNGEDVNGILFMATANLALLCSGQYPAFDAGQASAIGGYAVGAVVARADGTGCWINTTNANTTNPDNDAPTGNGWVPGYNYGLASVDFSPGGVNVPLGMGPASKAIVVITGALSTTLQVMFPNLTGAWIVVNATTGGQTVNATMSGSSSAITIPGGGFAQPYGVIGDGTNLYPNTVSTAGLAPLASPNFTGTPTAPTAPGTSNTTQIATTAFAKAAVTAGIAGLAPLASPNFTGAPTAPTPAPGSNNALLAPTAFVTAAIAAAISGFAPIANPVFTGVPQAPTAATSVNNTQLATTAFVHALAGSTVIASVNGGLNFSNGVQFRWGVVSQTVGGTQAHSFSTPFSTGCYVVIPVVASSTGVEFFSVQGSPTASGWSQYSNNTTTINYVAIGF